MDDEKAVTKEIAMRIKTILKNNGMTVSGLAYQAGMSPSTIYSLYSDKCQNIGVNTLWMICAYGFECKLSDLFSSDWDKITIPKYKRPGELVRSMQND